MSKPFRIYAVPRGADNRYLFGNGQPVYVREFARRESMFRHWQERLLPATCSTFGLKYKLSMVEIIDGKWEFVGDPRYADSAVLRPRKIADGFTMNVRVS
ncbi:MAG: hypothetical protein HOI35_09130 [Woeseia sp.]|nr:hypothetical protein [Woeseia sp.]